MEALITTAWRAFWVGLGASAVLIGQAVLAPAPVAPPPSPSVKDPAPIVVPRASSEPVSVAPVSRARDRNAS